MVRGEACEDRHATQELKIVHGAVASVLMAAPRTLGVGRGVAAGGTSNERDAGSLRVQDVKIIATGPLDDYDRCHVLPCLKEGAEHEKRTALCTR